MERRTYQLYVNTFRRAQAGLRAGDEALLRAVCADVAGRSGLESTIALLAISDAERGVCERGRREIVRRIWGGPRGNPADLRV